MPTDNQRVKRHRAILELLAGQGEVLVEGLARRFGVDLVTIRRDLAWLERDGLLRRTHGGAVASRIGRIELAFQKKSETRGREKAAIAQAVAAMVRPGMAISLDTRTTTLEVAREVAGTPGLKVLTPSLAIVSALYPHDNIEIVLLGGVVRRGSPDLYGVLTEDNVRRFTVDMAILGADAVSPDGLFTTDAGVSRVSQAMIKASRTAVLVIDSGKFGAAAFVRFATWDEVDHVVTDEGAPPDARAWLEKAVARVTYVPVQAQQDAAIP